MRGDGPNDLTHTNTHTHVQQLQLSGTHSCTDTVAVTATDTFAVALAAATVVGHLQLRKLQTQINVYMGIWQVYTHTQAPPQRGIAAAIKYHYILGKNDFHWCQRKLCVEFHFQFMAKCNRLLN